MSISGLHLADCTHCGAENITDHLREVLEATEAVDGARLPPARNKCCECGEWFDVTEWDTVG